jgi:hypothetical protein
MRRLAVLLALAGACSGPQTPNAGFDVTVKLTARSKAKCVVVFAGSQASNNISLGGRTQIEMGIAQDDPKGSSPLAETVSLVAKGFLDADCASATFNEDSTPEMATFVDGKVISKTLTLDGPRDSDADKDGFRSNNDCDDTNAAVFPGATEVCNNHVDDNCDTLIDCADTHCSAMPCDDGDPCSATAACSGSACIRTSTVACSSPGQCQTAPGLCDAGQCVYPIARGQSCIVSSDAGFCTGSGMCINGEVLCDNGIDDDHDGLTDCADTDCDTQPCDAGACSQNGHCSSSACMSTPVVCAALGAGCLPAVGCSEDAGGCFYGAPLDAGSPCTGGSCRHDGGCGLVESNCLDGVDNDDDGLTDCADSSCDTLMCSDGNVCTTNDTCASGVCKGGPIDPCSSPPDACHTATGAMCTPQTACLYPIAFDAPCDGGVCGATGTCAPSLFPYVPSNFNPDTVAPPTRNVVVICAYWFDTDAVRASFDPDGGLQPDGGSGCFPPRFTPTVVHQDGGDDLLVLATKDLVIMDGGSLNFIGSRPVALAVYGDALVDHGFLFAGSFYPLPGADAVGAGGSAPAGRYWGTKSFCDGGSGGNGLFANQAASGGGGGAFGSTGGPGGMGDGAGSGNFVNGGDAGTANGGASLVPLRGGCAGGAGGPQGDLGGYGGGALQVSVAGRFVINGSLVGAPGGGGFGGDSHDTTTPKGGGGGGGSGGAVLLEALHLRFANSALTANGGGGGGGDGDHNGGQLGAPGAFGYLGSGFSVGGAAGGNGGNGGNGASTAAPAGPGGNATSDNAAGGGGGGGFGRIRIFVPDGGTCDLPNDGSVVISPQAVQIGCP